MELGPCMRLLCLLLSFQIVEKRRLSMELGLLGLVGSVRFIGELKSTIERTFQRRATYRKSIVDVVEI